MRTSKRRLADDGRGFSSRAAHARPGAAHRREHRQAARFYCAAIEGMWMISTGIWVNAHRWLATNR
jgi:hypothetical protein